MVLPGRTVCRFGYVYEGLERPYFEVEESDTQKLRFSINATPWKDFTARGGYTYAHTDMPFTHLKAALSPQIQPTPSPREPPVAAAGHAIFRHVQGSAGELDQPADRFMFDFAFTYDNYQDHQPYLVDATGKSVGMKLGLNWMF